jgi:hypothetical protein
MTLTRIIWSSWFEAAGGCQAAMFSAYRVVGVVLGTEMFEDMWHTLVYVHRLLRQERACSS